MKKHILFSLLLLVAIGCNTKQENTNDCGEYWYLRGLFPNDSNKTSLLISFIKSSKYVEDRYIGFCAKESDVYECYQELLRIASDSLWLELTYSESAVMRYYAYMALHSKGDPTVITEAQNRLKKDSANVGYYSCDIISNMPLGSHVALYTAIDAGYGAEDLISIKKDGKYYIRTKNDTIF